MTHKLFKMNKIIDPLCGSMNIRNKNIKVKSFLIYSFYY